MGKNEPDIKGSALPDGGDDQDSIVKGSANDLSRGPVEKRGCTDILFLILFVLSFGAFFYVAAVSMKNGRGFKLNHPRDWAGRTCGDDNDAAYVINGMHDLTEYGNMVLMSNVTALFGDQVITIACKHQETFISAGCNGDSKCKANVEAVCSKMDQKSVQGTVINILADPTAKVNEGINYVIDALKGVVSGKNYDVTKYNQKTCIQSCDAYNKIVNSSDVTHWDTKFSLDFPIGSAWNTFVENLPSSDESTLKKEYTDWGQKIKDSIKVMPPSVCPYKPSDCVFNGKPTKRLQRECLSINEEDMESIPKVKNLVTAAQQTFLKFQDTDLGTAIGAIEDTWTTFLIVAAIAVVAGLIFLVALRFSVVIMVWLSVLFTFLLLVCIATSLLWLYAGCKRSDSGVLSVSFDPSCEGGQNVISKKNMRTFYLVASIICYVVTALYLCVILCICKAIRLAIKLSKVAARFIYSNPLSISVPLIQIFVLVCWLIAFLFLEICAVSSGDATDILKDEIYNYTTAVGTDSVAGKCTGSWPDRSVWKDVDAATCRCPDGVCDTAALECWKCGPVILTFGWKFWFILWQYLWTNAMILAIGQMVLAGAVGTWYFNQDRLGKVFPIMTGVKNTFVYHLGTVAFGSFILALVRLVQWWLQYMKKQADASKNGVMAKVATALIYCVKCFERCIEFLNTFAYIRCALTGESFCKSAYRAFKLNTQNIRYVAVVTSVSSIIKRLGSFLVACASAVCGYYIRSSQREDLDVVLCIGLDFVLGWLIGRSILSVFQMSCLSALSCYLCDKEMGNGVAEHVPSEMKSFYNDMEEKAKE